MKNCHPPLRLEKALVLDYHEAWNVVSLTLKVHRELAGLLDRVWIISEPAGSLSGLLISPLKPDSRL